MKILVIETSCDETSAAVISEEKNQPILLSNIVSSQIDLHKKYGGVVPEVAARAHIEKIIPVITEALLAAKSKLSEIDYFAVTHGPGLVGSLIVGVETAKALGIALEKPVIPINHLEGHIYANFVSNVIPSEVEGSLHVGRDDKTRNYNEPQFPIVALLVSGGHTMLIYMKKHLDFKVIGQTRDDAAGEAFDKAAKILELGYPGGPIISHEAEKGDASKYAFPIIDLTEKPKRGADGFMIYPKLSLDFSFSGLKTSLITKTKTCDLPARPKPGEGGTPKTCISDLAASFQKALVDTLVQNSLRAVEQYKPKTFILSGGVAANKLLRESLTRSLNAQPRTNRRFGAWAKPQLMIPATELCTDNAGMIGAAAYYYIKLAPSSRLRAQSQFAAEPNLKF